MKLFYDKVCARCNKLFQPIIGPKQKYCGSVKLQKGCALIVCKENKLRKQEKARAKAKERYKEKIKKPKRIMKYKGYVLTAELKENHLVPEDCTCGRKFIRTPSLATCPVCRFKTIYT
jgi:hypothetical protein